MFYKRTDNKYFLILYACVAYYFSLKMVRLVPSSAVCGNTKGYSSTDLAMGFANVRGGY